MFIVMPPDIDGERVTINFASVGKFGVEGNFLTIRSSYGTEDYCIEYRDEEEVKSVYERVLFSCAALTI